MLKRIALRPAAELLERLSNRRSDPNDFADGVKQSTYDSADGKCGICNEAVGSHWDHGTYHHRKPVSEGGTGSAQNCMLVHGDCHDEHSAEIH